MSAVELTWEPLTSNGAPLGTIQLTVCNNLNRTSHIPSSNVLVVKNSVYGPTLTVSAATVQL